VEPGDPIYAIYTSGSTGTPKAAVVPHRGITNRFRWMDEYFGAGAAAVVLQTTRHVYDSAVWQLLWPLVNGGRTVLPRSDEDLAAEPLAGLVRAHGVTMTDFVPSVFNFLVPRLVGEGELRRSLASLRAVVVGGEQISTATTHTFLGCFPQVRVVNLYGPTEASIGCICYEVKGAEEGRIPIGRPIHNTQALVLDRRRQPVPVGVPGELYLSGACLGVGYLHDEVRTGEVFVENPFPELGCDRMYRTGDRVRWLPDGNLDFLGRVDEQVKIRGFRIEPGEIETALRAHPAVREAAVVAREDSPGQKRLVAYVAPTVAGGLSAAELRDHLSMRLPTYMVPGTFVELERLPLNANGKVDRRALPAPERLRSDEEYVPPRDALELMMVGAWEEVLGTSPVGVRDSFFELGGHSLLAVRLVGRIQKLTGQRLPLASLFTAPTVEGLAAVLRGGAAGAAARPLVPIQPAGNERPLFFVHAAGGNVIGYAELSRHLGSGQPFYGLQSRGLDGQEAPHARVEAMATDYLVEIRAIQPEGPYRLGGWSMGGLVAFEMARQAEAAGEVVELLALVDPSVPAGVEVRPLSEADDPDLLASFARHLGISAERISVTSDEILALDPAERPKRAWEVARAEGILPPDLDYSRFGQLWNVFRHNVEAARLYRPGRNSATVDVSIVSAEERNTPPETIAAAWQALTSGRVEFAVSPGDHFSMVREPHVRELAARLGGVLASTPPRGQRC
jgi:amino acid adenylation domain-containing protein